MLQKLPWLSLLIFLSQCSKPLPALEGIDLVKWKSDKGACLAERKQMIATLDKQRDKLKGLSEADIIQLLGRPDQNELYKRNQKFYYYTLRPTATCPQPDSIKQRLSIRFTAMGIAKEVIIE